MALVERIGMSKTAQTMDFLTPRSFPVRPVRLLVSSLLLPVRPVRLVLSLLLPVRLASLQPPWPKFWDQWDSK